MSVTELVTNRVHYVKRDQDGTFDYGGLVPSSSLAKFLKTSWKELSDATR
ncbi:hypothetical protein [Burkholderia pseudomallei]|nr:hypothetical protein [Burkholderia pseudomallei]QRM23551.1 hypothetical protein JQX71_04500 [Burkholderia pseudomallei]